MVKNLSRYKVVIAILIVAFLFIGPAVAEEKEECSQTTVKTADHYQCASNACGAYLHNRETWVTSGCGLPSVTSYSYNYNYKKLADWLKCDSGQTAGWFSSVKYNCRGDCLEKPSSPTYNEKTSSSKVDLPAKLSWTNVKGFGNMAEKGPISYNVTIDNTNASPGERGSFGFEHDYSGTGSFPLFSSLPGLDLSQASPDDGKFVSVGGKYRFARPTPHSTRSITSCFGQRWQSWKIPPSWGFHNGVDISSGGKISCTNYGVRFGANVCVSTTPMNAIPIFASAPGTITFAGDGNGGGNMVTINHTNYSFDQLADSAKKETRYMHMSMFSASAIYGSIRSGDWITPSGEIWGNRETGRDKDNKPIIESVKIRSDNVLGWMGSTGVSTGAHLHFEIKINNQVVDPLSLVTIPDGKSWLGSVPCLKAGSTALKSSNILASLPGEEDPYDEKKEEFYQFTPPFSYKTEGNLFATNVKGNSFSAENCLLKPSGTYNWTAQACCNWDGTECGPTASWSFSTSDKMEQLKQGTEEGIESDPEIIYNLEDANLRWCEMRIEEKAIINGKQETIYMVPDRYEVQVEQESPFLWFFSSYQTHPFLKAIGGSILRVASPPATSPPTYVKNEDFLLFTKSSYAKYRWRVRACIGNKCNDFTPDRYILVSDNVKIKAPEILSPSNNPSGNNSIGWPVTFKWNASLGANSYLFEIFEGGNLIYDEVVQSSPSDEFGKITRVHELTLPKKNFNFKLDTQYKWQVTSCWDTEAKLCEPDLSIHYFKTTGKAPELVFPSDNSIDVSIPLILEWEKVPGAKSYLLNLDGKEKVITENRGRVNLEQDTTYSWSVKSCNDIEGTVCGESSPIWSFRTINLAPPQALTTDRETYDVKHNVANLSWNEVDGANYYHVSISRDNSNVLDKIVDQAELKFQMSRAGVYDWSVSACLDEECLNSGPPSSSSILFIQSTTNKTGLVPCGRDHNDVNTPWDETEPCEIRHLIILFNNILDFLLWNLMPIILLIMLIVSGITFYTSLGNPNTLAKIKGVWLSVGKGLIIIFFAWTAITIIMAVIGYRGIFGPWWQISF